MRLAGGAADAQRPDPAIGAELGELFEADPISLGAAAPRLLQIIHGPSQALRILATVLAGRAGGAGIPLLLAAHRGDDAVVRRFAMIGLGQNGADEHAAAALVDGLIDPDPEIAALAAAAFKRGNRTAVPALRKLAQRGDPLSHAAAARALGNIHAGSGQVPPELDAARRSPNDAVVIAGSEATVKANNGHGAALADLISRFDHDDPTTRQDALQSCGRLMELAAPAAANVRRLLQHDEAAAVRATAATALVLIASTAMALPALTDALADQSVDVGRAALIALAALGDRGRAAGPAIMAVLADNSRVELRQQAEATLVSIGAQGD